MVQHLPYDITESYFEDNKCTNTEKCDGKNLRCVHGNCCNYDGCLHDSNVFPFKNDYVQGSSNNEIINNNINNNAKTEINYYVDIDRNSETKNKINNDNDVDFNKNKSDNLNIETKMDINTNKNNNDDNSNHYNDNSIPFNNTVSSIINNNNINNSNDRIPFLNDNKSGNKINLVSISTISIIIIIISGILYSLFFTQKKRKTKQNEKYLNTTYKSEFSLSLMNDELKDPIESCEEYINTLSRLRYKDPISVCDPENPLQTFYLFRSPSLSSNASFFTPPRESNILVPEPIMIDPQFEQTTSQSLNISHKSDLPQYTLIDRNSLNLDTSSNDESAPLLDTIINVNDKMENDHKN